MLPGTGSSDTLSLPSVSCLALLRPPPPYGHRNSGSRAAFSFTLRGFRLHAVPKPVCAFSQQIPACIFFLPAFFPDSIICLCRSSCKLFLFPVHTERHLQTAFSRPQVPKKRNDFPFRQVPQSMQFPELLPYNEHVWIFILPASDTVILT